MSKRVWYLRVARTHLDKVEPLLADLPDTVRRASRYHGLRPPRRWQAMVRGNDNDLDDAFAPAFIRVDQAIRKISGEWPTWSSLTPDDAVLAGEAKLFGVSATLCSHPNGHVREAALRTVLAGGVGVHNSFTIGLRCLDPVPQIRDLAAEALHAQLSDDPQDLRPFEIDEACYRLLATTPRARRLVPDLADHAEQVALSNHWVERRDRHWREARWPRR